MMNRKKNLFVRIQSVVVHNVLMDNGSSMKKIRVKGGATLLGQQLVAIPGGSLVDE